MKNDDTGSGGLREPSSQSAAAVAAADSQRSRSDDMGRLGPDEAAHLEQMRGVIDAAIASHDGWIPFEHFMDLALYAPGLGYYSAGAPKLGRDGDFMTAPEVSPLFGRSIAAYCAPLLRSLSTASILEVGAGTGRLAFDCLQRLEELDALPARYWILEVSADLRGRQRELLSQLTPALARRVSWLDALPAEEFDGIVLANEVLDALPVRRFRLRDAAVDEVGVVSAHGVWQWQARPADTALASLCRDLELDIGDRAEGTYEGEICTRLAPWSAAVTARLRHGLALWIDYGLPRRQLYLPERADGTLLCHFRHRAFDDPLLLPGLADITAWVDFTRLAEAGRAAGFDIAMFTTQAHFLIGAGIDAELDALIRADPAQQARYAAQVRTLMLPGEMGERFKVMGWTRGVPDDALAPMPRDFRSSL